MKLALIAPPFIEVPPKGYGGIERRLHDLGVNLISLGVNIDLFASGDSQTPIPLKPICDIALFNEKFYDHGKDKSERTKEINQKTVNLISDGDYDLSDKNEQDIYANANCSAIFLPALSSIRNLSVEITFVLKEERSLHR